MPTQDEVVNAIKTVFDPEIPVNVYDLGLIYEIDATDDAVDIKMSLTSPSCPSAQQIPVDIRNRIAADTKVDEANIKVNVVWDPPWSPARISENGKKILGMDDEEE